MVEKLIDARIGKGRLLRIRETLIKAKLYKYKKPCLEQITIYIAKQETSANRLDYSDSALNYCFSGYFFWDLLLFKEDRDVEKNKDPKFLSINKIAALIITGLYLYNGFQIFLFLRSTGTSTVANQKENATD